ncbi:MAG: hydrogenase maturation peptidase HycI [candidate division WOR-3 bacterium]
MPVQWKGVLRREIKDAKKICILAVGNAKRGDDTAGPLILTMLSSRLKKRKFRNLLLINGGETPENFSGNIRKFQPTLTIIIDACISGKKPGTIYLVNPAQIQFDDISTHRLPLSMFVKFLEQTIPTRVIVLGIEPKKLNFGDDISPEINRTIDSFVPLMVQLLNDWRKLKKEFLDF